MSNLGSKQAVLLILKMLFRKTPEKRFFTADVVAGATGFGELPPGLRSARSYLFSLSYQRLSAALARAGNRSIMPRAGRVMGGFQIAYNSPTFARKSFVSNTRRGFCIRFLGIKS
jgi:hypothetical protein